MRTALTSDTCGTLALGPENLWAVTITFGSTVHSWGWRSHDTSGPWQSSADFCNPPAPPFQRLHPEWFLSTLFPPVPARTALSADNDLPTPVFLPTPLPGSRRVSCCPWPGYLQGNEARRVKRLSKPLPRKFKKDTWGERSFSEMILGVGGSKEGMGSPWRGGGWNQSNIRTFSPTLKSDASLIMLSNKNTF